MQRLRLCSDRGWHESNAGRSEGWWHLSLTEPSGPAGRSTERQSDIAVVKGVDGTKIIIALAPALILVACERTQTAVKDERPAPAVPSAANAKVGTATAEDLRPARSARPDGLDDGYPDLVPPVLTPEAEQSATGARNVLLSFARAIELSEYGQAWTLLSSADKQKWSRDEFAAIFADLANVVVAIPAGTSEGAAGWIYYTAPITVTGSDTNGRPVRIEGEVIVRRVNNVDGASPAQLRWHFDKLALDVTH